MKVQVNVTVLNGFDSNQKLKETKVFSTNKQAKKGFQEMKDKGLMVRQSRTTVSVDAKDVI